MTYTHGLQDITLSDGSDDYYDDDSEDETCRRRHRPRDYDSSHEFLSLPSRAFDKAEEIARRVWEAGWTVVHHHHLPNWLRDNDFLIKGHRPPLNSVWACFKSIFRIHTETGNIWTHLLGMYIRFCSIAAVACSEIK